MAQTFRGYLSLRIAILASILVAITSIFYVVRSGEIERSVHKDQAEILGDILTQRLEKEREVGVTNAITLAGDIRLASMVRDNDSLMALAEIRRLDGVFKELFGTEGPRIQLFTKDYKVFLRSWKPGSAGDMSRPVVPLLERVASSGKAMADYVVDKDGFYIRSTAPLLVDGELVGFVQTLRGVGEVASNFEADGISYGLLMEPDAASFSSAFADQPTYDEYPLAKQAWFSDKTKAVLGTINILRLVRSGSMTTDSDFALAMPLKDFNGHLIGYHVLAQPRGIVDARIQGAISPALVFIGIMIVGILLMGVLIIVLLNKALLGPMHGLAGFAKEVADGGEVRQYSGPARFELKVLTEAISSMVVNLDERTIQAKEQARFASGKAREAKAALEKASTNERHVSELLESMRKASSKAEEISKQVYSSVNALSGEVDQVAGGVTVQRDRMASIATAMEEMNATVAEVARNASDAAVNASESSERATTGAAGVREAVSSISRVESRILGLKDTMGQLGDEASSIGEVLNVITDIADQTNLLALNAAIEAARAGEAGRGFAVVADEVRKLAEKTMAATKEVESVIVSIQDAAKDNVIAVEAAAEDMARSTQSSREAGQFMEEIVGIVADTSGQVDSIATAAEEQSATSEEINRAVTDMNRIAGETAEGMRSSADNLASITALISDLDATVQAMTSVESLVAYDDGDDLVTWTDKLSVGILSIDEQHKKLVRMINDLNRAMREKRSRATMLDIVSGLGDYVVTHFGYEEKLFDRHGYPEMEAHKEIHRQFVAKVQEFGEALSSGKATVSLEVLQFLKDWLVDHIMGTDKQYSKFMVEHGVR